MSNNDALIIVKGSHIGKVQTMKMKATMLEIILKFNIIYQL